MADDKFTGVYSKYNEDDLPGEKFDTYDELYVKELQEENRMLREAYNAVCERNAWPEVNIQEKTVVGHNELVKRLRYYDLYTQVKDQEKTIFGQAADTIELLQKALKAMEELASAQDEKVRGLERENGGLKKYIAEGAPEK